MANKVRLKLMAFALGIVMLSACSFSGGGDNSHILDGNVSISDPGATSSQSGTSLESGVESSSSSLSSQSSIPSSSSSPSQTSSSTSSSASSSSSSQNAGILNPVTPPPDEVRSVWISYLELEKMMKNKSGSEFRTAIAKQMDTVKRFGLNTVILQVRPFGDAIYKSSYFPASYLYTGTQGSVGSVPYDALQIAIEEAKKRSLRIEAWINPYRVTKDNTMKISADNPAKAMLATGDAVSYDGKITYNPASVIAQDLIVSGVHELVTSYNIDAIHFDDYFYPTTDAAFDQAQYKRYKDYGGKLSLAQWRRQNVTDLVKRVYDTIKSVNPKILFGISPQGNNDNNLNGQYVDVQQLMKLGIIDYLCPQMYFGFKNQIRPYSKTLAEFNELAKNTGVKLYTGLATYKFGKEDTWAGVGKNEWIDTEDIIARQVNDARKLSEYGGFVLFRYESTFDYNSFYGNGTKGARQAAKEMDNLKAILN